MARKNPERLRKECADSPVYWFAVYEAAIINDDSDEARLAKARLGRLGYTVDRRETCAARGGGA